MRNKAGGWNYGHDPEYDIVIISKNGTIGPIVEIGDIRIALPEIPDKKEIINWDEPAFNQKWRREQLPKGLNFDTQYNKAYEEYIVREWYRRNNGVYIWLNGKMVYMPGSSYFFYTWIHVDEGYARFRVIQNELILFWEACKADHRCYGVIYTKNRRFGWSTICIGQMIETGTKSINALMGIISKTGDDAKSMFSKLVRAFKKLPPFFTPVWDGTTTPKTELLLSEPTSKRSRDQRKIEGDGLDSIIRYYHTVLNSMDGERVKLSAIDECGKFPKTCPFDQYWSIIKTSHRVGARIVGKAMVGSTVNSMKKGGQEFKDLYYNSDPLKRNKNGQTQSGLYKLFISAEYCIDNYFDEYGFSIADDPEQPVRNEYGNLVSIGANTFLDNELEGLIDNPNAYNEQLRQFPRQENHAFRDEAVDCRFDLAKLYEQMDHNDHELPKSHIQKGNFHWKDGIQDGDVVWSPDPNGRFYVTWHPPEEIRNKFNWETRHGIYSRAPIAEHIGAGGVDPYNRSVTVKKEASNGSIHFCTKFNMTGAPCNEFFLEYIDRPAKVELFFEDVIMAMKYYSMPILAELSNEKFLSLIKDRGYRHYSMTRPGIRWSDLTPTERELGGAPPQNQIIGEAQFYAIESYIVDHVGVAKNANIRPLGTMGNMPFNRTLMQWKDVDPDKRTKYDAYISSSLARMANQKIKSAKTQVVQRVMSVATYENKGLVSHITN